MNVSNEVKLMLRSRNEQNKWDLYQMEVFSVGFEVWIHSLYRSLLDRPCTRPKHRYQNRTCDTLEPKYTLH